MTRHQREVQELHATRARAEFNASCSAPPTWLEQLAREPACVEDDVGNCINPDHQHQE